MLEYNRINISEEIDINQTSASKKVIFVTIGILKIFVLSMSRIVLMVALI